LAIQTASGTARDKEDKSFVKSPTRQNFTAQEVVVGNSSANSIPVHFDAKGTVKADYSEITAGSLASVTVLNKTIAPLKGIDLLGLSFSGDNIAIVTVELNSQVVIKKRLTNTEFNFDLSLSSYQLTSGDNLKIIVENKKGSIANFNTTLFYSEYDA
jgi:hypothetical protein